MDLKQIHELIKIVNKSNIGEISIEDKDGKVTIKQKEEQVVTVAAAPQQVYNVAPQQAAPIQPVVAPQTQATPVPTNTITIKSPMIGTFYRKASPDKPSFAEVGTEIAPGKVVCIIEAMKLFNEIESEVKGTIVKVLVEDASPVEYDQPLFLVEPN
jgi:acetyl-CoA carboxylase biotin carboxyl carrier protein